MASRDEDNLIVMVSGTKIYQLTSDNYHMWKSDAKAILVDSDLWDYVNLQFQHMSQTFDANVARKAYAKLWLLILTEIMQDHSHVNTNA